MPIQPLGLDQTAWGNPYPVITGRILAQLDRCAGASSTDLAVAVGLNLAEVRAGLDVLVRDGTVCWSHPRQGGDMAWLSVRPTPDPVLPSRVEVGMELCDLLSDGSELSFAALLGLIADRFPQRLRHPDELNARLRGLVASSTARGSLAVRTVWRCDEGGPHQVRLVRWARKPTWATSGRHNAP